MPTIQAMELPKPKNWQDFERIVRDAQAQRWGSTDLQMHGRPGQTQDGVDIRLRRLTESLMSLTENCVNLHWIFPLNR
jgi:hypothetical protein